MNFGASIRRAWKIVTLDAAAVQEVAADPNATLPALIILAIGGALGGVGALNPIAIVVGAVLVPLIYFVWVGILFLLAKLFGGAGSYMPYYNSMGHGCGLVSWIGIIPILGALISLVWGVVVGVVVTREVHRFSTGKAVAVVLIPVLLLLTCVVILAVLVGAAIFAAISKGMHAS